MKIDELPDYTGEEIKKAIGYTDKVHRLIGGKIVEIDNPETLEEVLSHESSERVLHKLEHKGCRC